MIGDDGKRANNYVQGNKGVRTLAGQGGAANDATVQAAISKYRNGGMSLADALASTHHDNSGEKKKLQDAINQIKTSRGSRDGGYNAGLGAAGALTAGPMGALAGLFGGKSDADEAWDRSQTDIKNMESRLQELDDDEGLNRSREHELYMDPSTGTLAATDQVQNNPLFKSMLGKGGLNDRLDTEEQDLAKRGFSMQPEDYEAYGQASGDTARLYGQEENSLAQALASRGLSAGASGAAGVGFSGLQGNKTERLASAQRKIADDRMKTNMERLNNTRNAMMQGNKLAQSAVDDQFQRNVTGVNNYQNTLQNSAHAAQMEQGQENTGFDQEEATRGPSWGEFGMSLAGPALGAGLGAVTGGAGAGLGASLGQALGGTAAKKKSL
jgi:hypothetical protein